MVKSLFCKTLTVELLIYLNHEIVKNDFHIRNIYPEVVLNFIENDLDILIDIILSNDEMSNENFFQKYKVYMLDEDRNYTFNDLVVAKKVLDYLTPTLSEVQLMLDSSSRPLHLDKVLDIVYLYFADFAYLVFLKDKLEFVFTYRIVDIYLENQYSWLGRLIANFF